MTSGTAPPAGVIASKPPLTEPFEASLVAAVQIAVLAMPNRTSLSAMFPPLWPLPWVMFTPELRSTAEPCCSAARFTPTPIAKTTNIAANTAQACRRASTILPNMNTQAAGMQQDRRASR